MPSPDATLDRNATDASCAVTRPDELPALSLSGERILFLLPAGLSLPECIPSRAVELIVARIVDDAVRRGAAFVLIFVETSCTHGATLLVCARAREELVRRGGKSEAKRS